MSQVQIQSSVKKYGIKFSLYIGIFFILIFLALFLLSFVYPNDPTEFDMTNRFAMPSRDRLLGTDQFGRDVLARVMHSMRSVFTVGIGSVTVGMVIGTAIGTIAGASPQWLERILMSIIDGLIAFPGVLLAMLIVFLVGRGSLNTILAIGIMMIPVFARLAYSTMLEHQSKLYIKAAVSYGLSKPKIIWNHIFPALLPKIITQFTSSVAGAITIESSLSFLGLGIQPPDASLGLMLREAQQHVLLYPFQIMPAGIALIIVVLGFIFVGDALNDKLTTRRGV
ncbi:ABC transporter permease [Fundicoccus culcitae]|uniref:ABC transporter permease n=1 Tax=Fundicoccus culcitae TaxID=2969821 RepID=A0ABY5P5A2_9LACT|nr:ABC transporter permease [Fundicoccus culcitae]UUX33603.1 ABC transporter permease [Fundicoccus culcitae]